MGAHRDDVPAPLAPAQGAVMLHSCRLSGTLQALMHGLSLIKAAWQAHA